MRRFISIIFIILVFCFVVSAGDVQRKKLAIGGYCKAFFNLRTRQADYAGPGREESAPADIKEVLLGYFGPPVSSVEDRTGASHPHASNMWCAAMLAIEEANRAGGYKGLPFRLVAGWSDNPWASGGAQVVRMAYVDKVWAIIGGIDGPSTHLAEQVVTKARLTLLSPASTDKTVNLANVPWMFSCVPADHIQAPVLAEAIATLIGHQPFVMASAIDHDSHLFTVELAKSLDRHRLAPSYHFEFDPLNKDLVELARKITAAKTNAVVLVAGPQQSAQMLSALRAQDFAGLVFGGPSMGQRGFMEKAGKTAEGVIFPLVYSPGKSSESFEEKFVSRFGKHPDYLAAHTYDAVNLLIAAIQKAGLNRARIRDAVRNLSPWQGVTGKLEWDALGSNTRAVELGTIKDGCVQPLPEIKSAAVTYDPPPKYLR